MLTSSAGLSEAQTVCRCFLSLCRTVFVFVVQPQEAEVQVHNTKHGGERRSQYKEELGGAQDVLHSCNSNLKSACILGLHLYKPSFRMLQLLALSAENSPITGQTN